MSEQEFKDSRGVESSDAVQQSAGAQLRELRTERGMSVEDIATQLHLAPRQIVAIENDDHAALPGMPIVRGFIRSYAKLLRVDPAPLLTSLGPDAAGHQPLQPREGVSAPFPQTRVPSMAHREDGASIRWLIPGLALVLATTLLWATGYWREIAALTESLSAQAGEMLKSVEISSSSSSTQSAQTEVSNPHALPDVPASPSVPSTDLPSVAIESSVAVAGPSVTNDTNVQSSNERSLTAATNLASTELRPTNALEPSALPASLPDNAAATASASKDALVLRASEESWLEIRRAADSKVLLSKIVAAGESETFDVTEPISVVIGNASGMKATLRGTPVELKSGGNNVARLTLK